MLKKTLLSTALALSTIATAQVQLDLDMTITHNEIERHLSNSVVIDENIVTSIAFDNLDTLIVNVVAQTNGDIVALQAQFFQKSETEELIPATEPLSVQVPYDQPATITINDTNSDNTDDNGSLVLVITPSLVDSHVE